MHLLRRFARATLLGIASLSLAATCALASHVPGVLPLTSFSNHSHESHPNTNFPAADLTGIDLSFADLTNCTFAPGTILMNANFTGAKLVNSSLAGCILDGALFRGADLTGANLGCPQGADFRGAILTGVFANCGSCATPNLKDDCTVNPFIPLCLVPANFRGVIAGVVFHDQNSNGLPDLGEPGLPGVPVVVNAGLGPIALATDSRGAYAHVSSTPGPATVQFGALPAGYVASGPGFHSFNTLTCRTGQGRNLPATTPATPTVHSSFGRLKLLYR